MRPAPSQSLAVSDIPVNLASFARHLRAENASPRTVRAYSDSVLQLEAFLASRGMPTTLASIRREHLEAFIEDLLGRRHGNGRPWSPATAHHRYRGLRAYFRWLIAEGEIKEDPMARMHPPRLPEQDVAVVSDADLSAILATCESPRTRTRTQSFVDRRDAAILRVFIDTGIRLGEMAGLR